MREGTQMINNINSSRYIPLELSESLKKENLVSSFFYDKVTNAVKIELNHKMDKTDIILSINKKNWPKNGEMLTTILKRKGINDIKLIEILGINLDNNWHKIIDDHDNNYDENNHNLNNSEKVTISDLSDLSAQTKNHNNSDNFKNQSSQQQEEQESTLQNYIPLLTVLEAKRSSEGRKRVIEK
jgi:hypothetical protein